MANTPRYGSTRVSDIGRKGRADTKDAANPDRATPDSLGLPSGAVKFEAAAFAAHQARISREQTPVLGARAGSGSADFTAQKESRGISEHAQALSAARGNAPKRSKGKSTPGPETSAKELNEKTGVMR
jgi:hypothetical protein